MKIFSRFLVVLSLLCAGAALADEPRCPKLKDSQGIEWSYQQGPDFGLCYATDKETKSGLFGLYLGFAPQFHPGDAKPIGSGKVAARPVSWYAPEGGLEKWPFQKQTLVKLGKNNFIHAWISATTKSDMERAEAALAGMELRK